MVCYPHFGSTFKTALRLGIFLLALVAASSSFAQAKEAGPSAVISLFHEALLEAMKEADVLGTKGRYDFLLPRVKRAYHVPVMIRAASSSGWRNASLDQKKRLVGAFLRMSASTYASRFDGYSGQSFELLEERDGPQGTTLVKARIVSPEDKPVGLTYVMKDVKGRWGIVDVLLDNTVSELAVRRSEYRQVLKKDGLDGLISVIEEKAALLVQ
jgi:phospholipid transport system substrate-binding protein